MDEDLPPAAPWEEEAIPVQPPHPLGGDYLDLPPEITSPPREKGGMGLDGLSGGMMNGPGGRSPFSAYSFIQPESNLRNQPGTLQVRGEGMMLGIPVSIRPHGITILTTRLEHLAFDTTAALPGTIEPFPEELWNINLGVLHIHRFDSGWSAGGMVGVGSASDQPFASIREMNANLLAFLDVPTGERDAWKFSLFYSPMGQLAFPVPGIAYAWRPNERFQMNIGIPFSLNYRPTDSLAFDLSYLPLTNANATIIWKPDDLWTVYGGYQTQSQGYELANRLDKEERFFNFDQRLNLGVRRKLDAGFSLDFSAAYLFDRSYFRSDSFFGEGPELRVAPGTQLMMKLEWSR
jgi:hypothetical protein